MNDAVAEANDVDRRPREQVRDQILRRVVGGLQRRRRLLEHDLGLAQPERVEMDAAEQKIGEVEGDLGVLGGDRLDQGQARGVGQLERAFDGDRGEIMHPERSGQPDLSAGPGGERGGDPIMQLRLGADFPRQKGDAQEKEPDEAEQKPLPRQLARLHADLSTRFRRRRSKAAQSNRHETRLFIARLAPRGEPNSRIFLGYQELRNAISASVSDAGNRV